MFLVRSILMALALVTLSLVSVARADDAKMEKAHEDMHKACKADMDKLCKDAKGMDAMHACMEKHSADLSADCKKMHDEHEAMHSKMAACDADREKFCKDAKMGKDLHDCMKTHKTDLSADCKAATDAMMKEHHHAD